LDAGDELVNQATLAIGQPEFTVIDFLGKRLTSKAEMVEVVLRRALVDGQARRLSDGHRAGRGYAGAA
jgi:hypothetical protein